MFRVLILALFTALPAMAEGERAGKFDYYVMALSWTPNWCASEGDRKNSDQCDDDRGFGFTLHGPVIVNRHSVHHLAAKQMQWRILWALVG